ncbi:MAG: hypothetical protein OHK0029_19710 [Armatimonadaceae bacterium]
MQENETIRFLELLEGIQDRKWGAEIRVQHIYSLANWKTTHSSLPPPSNQETQQAAHLLVNLLTDSTEEAAIREAAAHTMYFFSDEPTILLRILTMIKELREDWLRIPLVNAANNSPRLTYSQVADAMITLLKNVKETPALRAEAAHTIGMMYGVRGPSRIAKALLPSLQDPSLEVRFYTCYALSQLGCRRVIPALMRLTNDFSISENKNYLTGQWSLAQEARWAVACLTARGNAGDPTDEIYQSPQWQDYVLSLKAKRRNRRKQPSRQKQKNNRIS